MKKILLIALLLVFKNSALAQNKEPNDCVNAIVVCGNGTFNSNANGAGKQEVAACNNSMEHNTVWIKINIVQSGKLGFDLIPEDTSLATDFDFWVFGPNKPCSNLGAAIRCCITNPVQAGLSNNLTGMNASTLANNAWSGGSGANNLAYVQQLTVTAGEFYYIAIDRPYTTPSGKTGFQIKWNGTANAGSGAFPTSPIANKIADQVTCSLTPNVGFFDLNSLRSQINPDLLSNTITFHTTLANATDGTSPLPNFYSTTISPQPIYARVVNNVAGCYSVTNFNLVVSPIPTASISLSKTQVCQGDNVVVTFSGTPGATVDYTINGGPVQSVLLDVSGKFLLSDLVLANRKYNLTRAKVLDGNNQEVCFTDYSTDPSRSVTVTVNPKPTVSGLLVFCQNSTSQLSGSGTPAASNPWVSSDITVATVSATGLVTGIASGNSNITYTDNNGCSATEIVNIIKSPTVSGASFICVKMSTQLNGSGTPAGSNAWVSSDPSAATVDQSGLVTGVSAGTVIITYTESSGCSTAFNMEVKTAIPLESATASVSGYFGNNSMITVDVKPDGSYLYKLDDGPYQGDNVFHDVSAGLHTVNISDTIGCTDYTISDILVVGYPHFFTPNGDGYNDTWNIWALSTDQPNAEIHIFDRFGKLLAVITPGGAGWDGTYNGSFLPSNDYWFTIKYIENGVEKIFKSHFTLKR